MPHPGQLLRLSPTRLSSRPPAPARSPLQAGARRPSGQPHRCDQANGLLCAGRFGQDFLFRLLSCCDSRSDSESGTSCLPLSPEKTLPVTVPRSGWDSRTWGDSLGPNSVVVNHHAGKTWGLCRCEPERGPHSSLKRSSRVHFCLPQAMPIQRPESSS